jgi:hypothetical protein
MISKVAWFWTAQGSVSRIPRTGTRMGFTLQFVFDTDHFRTQALLGLFLGGRPKSNTDAHASVLFVDDASTVGVDRNAGSAGACHDVLYWGMDMAYCQTAVARRN